MSSVRERLDARLRPEGAPERADDTTDWRVTDRSSAAYASRKLKRAHAAVAEIKAWEKEEIASVKEAAAAELRRVEPDIAFFQGHLAVYLHQLIKAGQKAKSLILPGGRIGFTPRPARIDIESDEKFIEWAKKGGYADLVRVKEEVAKDQLNKVAQLVEGGEVAVGGDTIPGVRWEAQTDNVNFKPKAGGDDEDEEGGGDDG